MQDLPGYLLIAEPLIPTVAGNENCALGEFAISPKSLNGHSHYRPIP